MKDVFSGIYTVINNNLPIIVWIMLGAFIALFLVAIGFAVVKLIFGGQDGVHAARQSIGKILTGALIALLASALAHGAQTALKAVKIANITVAGGGKAQDVVDTIVSAGNAILALLIAFILVGIVLTCIGAALMFLGGEDMAKKGKTMLMTCIIAVVIMLIALPVSKIISDALLNGYKPLDITG
ncbi:hypothetical protein [Lactococcus allomyrinae]|uniref:Uncharacterized protein n=1 Tax=Lactococcus allomyrinae TaxID=2419773 RepID=A0A387BG63_9LACT|nr:hypothetical protein [Lactococcus allomyrinae]AYF99829.1 hypothetical protein D7I46_01255 [Lactococcus allomyrinae]